MEISDQTPGIWVFVAVREETLKQGTESVKTRSLGNARYWKLQIPDLQRIFELVGSLVDLSSVSCHATQSVEKEMELSFIHINFTSGSSRYSWGGPLRCLCTSVQTYHVGRATH